MLHTLCSFKQQVRAHATQVVALASLIHLDKYEKAFGHAALPQDDRLCDT